MTRCLLAPTTAVAVLILAASPVSRADTALRVATFRCDVTPPLGEAIYSSYRPLATIEHPLLAKGVVLDDRNVQVDPLQFAAMFLAPLLACPLDEYPSHRLGRRSEKVAPAAPLLWAVHVDQSQVFFVH